MFQILALSFLLATFLASSSAKSGNECKEIGELKAALQDLCKRHERLKEAFYSVHNARSFATGSERLYTTKEGEGNFEKLNVTCAQAGGHVPSPQKEGENKALQSVLKRHNKPAYLVGHNSVGFTNWADGEPNNAGGTKNCAKMDEEGKWHSASCEEELLIVCEFSFI